jgi:hypothetical protein
MDAKVQLVLGLFLLGIILPGGIWIVWHGISTGRTAFRTGGQYIQREIPASRGQSPIFFWTVISFYMLVTLFAALLGFWEIVSYVHRATG